MRFSSFLLLTLAAAGAYAAGPQKADLWRTAEGLAFEPNRGQLAGETRYFSRTANGIVFLDARGFALQRGGSTLRFELAGGNAGGEWIPEDAHEGTVSYFVGRDPAKWVRDVPRYGRLTRRGVYPGIDLTYYGASNQLEYDFIVAPGADPSRIRIRVQGARRLSITREGELMVETANGAVRQHRPVLFQTRRDGGRCSVDGAFRLTSAHEAGFTVGAYDRSLPLSIDPVLDSSTYYGGSGDDKIVATDGTNVVGVTTSIDPPGGFRRPQGTDVFIRLGNQTFIYGGSGDDQATGAYFNSQYGGGVVAVGFTNSTDLPTNLSVSTNVYSQARVWQPDYAGGATDGFVIVVRPIQEQGYVLPQPWISYYGTAGDDRINAVAGFPYGSAFALAGSTNGTGLPSSLNDDRLVGPGGGLDGFAVWCGLSSFSDPSVQYVTRFGGSGDDVALAVAATYDGFYVAGGTQSSDFPLVNAANSGRSGASDAFVIKLGLGAPGLAEMAGTLFGGGGEDRATGLFLTADPALYVAGVTSSGDLPTVNPIQPNFGGGPADAFLAKFPLDLSRTLAATYIGGSAADEATALAGDTLGNLFLAGWTSSTDFPVRDALQPQYGGGPDDGFLVHLDSGGGVLQSTYFGGTGSDRILSVYAPSGPSAVVVGRTTSANLPLESPSQDTLKGASDGFTAKIATTVITAARAYTGKDLRVWTPVSTGRSGSSAPVVTVASSDPSVVQVAAGDSDAGQASTQLPAHASGFYADCLSDTSGADVSISAPGYPARTIRVDCVPAVIFSYGPGNPPTLRVWAGQGQLSFQAGAVDPRDPAKSSTAMLRPGVTAPVVTISNAAPAVAAVSSDTVNVNGYAAITGVSVGTAELSFSAPGFTIRPATMSIAVKGALNLQAGTSVPVGFQAGWSLGYFIPPAGAVVTVTSQDPSKLLISTNSTQAGAASVSLALSGNNGVYLQGIAMGDSQVTFAIQDQPAAQMSVHVGTPGTTVSLPAYGVLRSLGAGQSGSVRVLFTVDGVSGSFLPNPGTVFDLSLTSANPAIATVSPDVVHVDWNSVFPSFAVTGAAEGSTSLALHAPDGLALSNAASQIPVTVVKKAVRMDGVDLGKDLAAQMTIYLPAAAAANVKLSSSNPDLVLLSEVASVKGQATFSGKTSQSVNKYSFWVQGLAADGQATITAEVDGYDAVSATVTLGPSGFGWTADTYQAALYATSAGTVSVTPFVLDRATLLPIAAQSLRAGVTAAPQVVSSDPGIITVAPSSYSTTTFSVTAKSSGTAVLTLTQPEGFTTPAARRQLTVTVSKPVLTVSGLSVANGSQALVRFDNSLYNVNQPLTVTSTDPSRLVLSSDPNVLGGASVTVTSVNRDVYAQALAGDGSVRVVASAPTFDDGSAVFTLTPSGFGVSVSTEGYPPSAVADKGRYLTTTQSAKTKLRLFLYSVQGSGVSQVTPRPGLGSVTLSVDSSDSNVGVIAGSPITIQPSSPNYIYNPASVDFVPAGAGSTTVTVTQPPGYTAPGVAARVQFEVSLPGLQVNDVVAAKDTMTSAAVTLGQTVSPQQANLPVTITSSDPTRVLLSLDRNSPPGPSVTLTLVARSSSAGPVLIHALGASGVVPVTISAPGFANATLKVTLADLGFVFSDIYSGTIEAPIQAGAKTLGIFAAIVQSATNFTTGGFEIRPGAPDIVVNVQSSDPSVVTVDPAAVAFKAGSTRMDIQYTPVSPGTATLTLAAPSGYVAPAARAQVSIHSTPAALNFSLANGGSIGRDLQVSGSITSSGGWSRSTVLTVTSSDPSALLLSPDATTPGSGQVTITPGSGGANLWLQSLAGDGTATVTVAADGYQSGAAKVTPVPSAAVFETTDTRNVLTTAGAQKVGIWLTSLDPATFRRLQQQAPRPGANLSVRVTSTNPDAISVATPAVTFDAGGLGTVELRPSHPGTAIVSLGALPGSSATASSGGQLVFNVAEPDITLPVVAIGRDLQAPVQAVLNAALPAPSSDLTLNIGAEYQIALSGAADAAGTSSLPVKIRAGQHVSDTFYVQGVYPGSGSLYLGYGSSYTSARASGTVSNTSIVFKEEGQTLSNGAISILTVTPVLTPPATTTLSPLTVRGGANPIVVNVTSSNPAVLSVLTPQVVLSPGMSEVAVKAKGVGVGSATLQLSAGSYDVSQPRSSIKVVIQ